MGGVLLGQRDDREVFTGLNEPERTPGLDSGAKKVGKLLPLHRRNVSKAPLDTVLFS